MIRITVLYPKSNGSQFDMAYYLQKHIPLVKQRLTPLGLVGVDLEEGLAGGAPGAPASHHVIGSLSFSTMDDLQRAVATHGKELNEDIANFTNVAAEMLISRVIEPHEISLI